jgi:hypothetical protein
LFPLAEFGAVARTYPVACSGVRQRNFDYRPNKPCPYKANAEPTNTVPLQKIWLFYKISENHHN